MGVACTREVIIAEEVGKKLADNRAKARAQSISSNGKRRRSRIASEPIGKHQQQRNGGGNNKQGRGRAESLTVPSIRRRKEEPEMPCLTLNESEQDIVYRTWRRISSEISSIGTMVFMFIFHEQPQILKLFPFRDVPLDQLPENALFRSHASRFMLAVGAVIEDSSAASSVFYLLGQTHAAFHGFTLDFFSVFEHAINCVWASKLSMKQDSIIVWAKIFAFITQAMQSGYKAASLAASS